MRLKAIAPRMVQKTLRELTWNLTDTWRHFVFVVFFMIVPVFEPVQKVDFRIFWINFNYPRWYYHPDNRFFYFWGNEFKKWSLKSAQIGTFTTIKFLLEHLKSKTNFLKSVFSKSNIIGEYRIENIGLFDISFCLWIRSAQSLSYFPICQKYIFSLIFKFIFEKN